MSRDLILVRKFLIGALTCLQTTLVLIGVGKSGGTNTEMPAEGNLTEEFRFPDHIKKRVDQALNRPSRFELEGPTPRPPWVVYPGVEMLSMHWRMGGGEDYRSAFVDWFTELSCDEQSDYKKKYPLPDSWGGYYEFLEEETVWRKSQKNSKGD